MAEVLTGQEMRRRYAGEWLLVAYEHLDDDLRVVRGEVLAHSASRDEIYGLLRNLKGRAVAIDYAGDIPEDLVLAL